MPKDLRSNFAGETRAKNSNATCFDGSENLNSKLYERELMTNNEATSQTGSPVSLPRPDDQTLPKGSRLTLKTIRDLLTQIQQSPNAPDVGEWAKEGKRLTEGLLNQYETQTAHR